MNIWQGSRVRLRGIEPSDWETFYNWNFDSEMARRLYFIPFPQSKEAVQRWTEKISTHQPDNDEYNWGIENPSGGLVGTITSHNCDPRHGTFGYGVSIRNDQRRKGYASEAVLILLRYFFQERRYQKATVLVYDFNEASIRLHEKLGFQLEGRLRRMGYTDGKYYDHLFYGLTVEEFEARESDHLG